MVLNKNFIDNEFIIVVLFAVLLYSLSNIININKHGMVKGLLLLFSVIICSKCSMPTGLSCSLLLIIYLYVINSKQKESFNTGRVGQGLDDIAEGIVHGAEDMGKGIVDGVKDVGGGIGKAGKDMFGKKKSNDSDSDSDGDSNSETDSDAETDSNSDTDSDPYGDDDHPSDFKEKIDTSEEDKLYKQYEKCMYGDKILDDNADDYEDDINDRIDHVNKINDTPHCGDKRPKKIDNCGLKNSNGNVGNKMITKVKEITNILDKDMTKLKLLIRKFYKSIDDENLDYRNLVETRDSFDNAYKHLIIMVDYVNKLSNLNKENTKKIVHKINKIVENINSLNISRTVKKNYKLNDEQQDMTLEIGKNFINIASTIQSLKQLL